MNKAIKKVLLLTLLAGPYASAVILIDHDFAADSQNWGDRDAGEMDVNWTGSLGNPSGSMQGDFADNIFTPETDAFQLTTGLGDLTQGGLYDLTQFNFQFYAQDVTPSDLILRFGNGSFTFFTGFTVPGIGQWYSFSASLASVAGWFGGTQSDFDNTLANTTFIELQVTRSGSDAQTYFFDNFQLQGNEDDGGDPGGGGGSSVPEPNTVNLIVSVAIIVLAMRRFKGLTRSVAEPVAQ